MADQRDEFISEAQEIIEGLSRDLLAIDEAVKTNSPAHELINDVFRAVHTLKGIAGLFGVSKMSNLSHHLEDVLDGLRLGKIPFSNEILDVLFRAVEVYNQTLGALRASEPEPQRAVEELLMQLDAAVARDQSSKDDNVTEFDLDPSLLAVLTEYEEHRLRSNLQHGNSLFILRVRFDLATIDNSLDQLKSKARPHGEILTYLPSGEPVEIDMISLDVLMASGKSLTALREALLDVTVDIAEVPRRRSDTSQPGASEAATPEDTSRRSPAPASPPNALSATSITPPADARRSHNPGDANAMSIRGVAQTVRVDIRRLDHLMNIVAELSMVKSNLGRLTDRLRGDPVFRAIGGELHRLHRTFDRQLSDLQSGILEVRMVPLGQVFEKLARVIRQVSREQDKEIHLVITGAETEVDKLIIEELSDPLMHMVRNAIDHGVEDREERHKKGKPVAGTIALNAYQKGNHVVIEVQDDGAGIDETKVLKQAIRRGLVSDSEAHEITRRDVLNFIFLPGFSTKEEATEISGRGVGMDVVKTNIGRMGGVIDVHSEVGVGTKMTVTLPITLAIISALVVVVAGRRYAIPLSSVNEALTLDPSSIRTIEGREVMNLRGATLTLCRLAQLFGLEQLDDPHAMMQITEASFFTAAAFHSDRQFVVIMSAGSQRMGCVVDRLIGQQDIVIKALGKTLAGVRGFSGATELGDQHVGLVIDSPALLEEVLTGAESSRLAMQRRLLTGGVS